MASACFAATPVAKRPGGSADPAPERAQPVLRGTDAASLQRCIAQDAGDGQDQGGLIFLSVIGFSYRSWKRSFSPVATRSTMPVMRPWSSFDSRTMNVMAPDPRSSSVLLHAVAQPITDQCPAGLVGQMEVECMARVGQGPNGDARGVAEEAGLRGGEHRRSDEILIRQRDQDGSGHVRDAIRDRKGQHAE